MRLVKLPHRLPALRAPAHHVEKGDRSPHSIDISKDTSKLVTTLVHDGSLSSDPAMAAMIIPPAPRASMRHRR